MDRNQTQVCSQAVYDLLVSFNALPSLEEQQEVLDVIYDAMYRTSYREVIRDRVVRRLRDENALLSMEVDDLREKQQKISEVVFSNGKKKLRETKRELLRIICNLRHYLGDEWHTILPWGSEQMDRYLEEIDHECILRQNTWRAHEEQCRQDAPDTF